jgi:putative sterol carrier protein
MVPIGAMLIGALLIAGGLFSASIMIPTFGIVVSLAGVVTLLVGIVMLFGIARNRK